MRLSINDDVTEKIEELAESWHREYEIAKNVQYGFKKFHILVEENDEIVGILIGYTAFSEIYVDNLVVHENYRKQGIGRMLLQKLEEHFEGKNYSNINLVTNEFQAPDFYKKRGYTLEFIRKNERFPLLSKYLCECENADVYFLAGGTQANLVIISSLLDSYEGVISADTGHINGHKAGAVEYTGYKIIGLPNHDGKIFAEEIEKYIKTFYENDSHSHMIFPGMVYISHPTEYGTIYSKNELEKI